MRTFAQKQNQPQKQLSSSLARSNTATSEPNLQSHPILHLQRTIGNAFRVVTSSGPARLLSLSVRWPHEPMSNAKNSHVARCIVTFLCDGCQIAEQSLRTSPYEKK